MKTADMDAMQPIFRFAPSPNGRLHLGHAYSALLNEKMAGEAGGRLLLRIEDTDQTRCKPEFVDAVFEDLQWLGVRWEEPVRQQSKHIPEYHAAILKLWDVGAIYPCFCSRKQAAVLPSTDPDGQAHYGGICRGLSREEAQLRLQHGEQVGWRIRAVGDLKKEWGDVVVAKPVVGSSYHIAVVVDDALQRVTHVVRGRDMAAATSIHRELQRLLGLPAPHYHHHALVEDGEGLKLSKSRQSQSLHELRLNGITAKDVRVQLGFAG